MIKTFERYGLNWGKKRSRCLNQEREHLKHKIIKKHLNEEKICLNGENVQIKEHSKHLKKNRMFKN